MTEEIEHRAGKRYGEMAAKFAVGFNQGFLGAKVDRGLGTPTGHLLDPANYVEMVGPAFNDWLTRQRQKNEE
ncbi:MAG: hypothetical protein KGJ23_07735 [Euryarchaeota archaeon]|nr:hypothetical protein [Euryarchaeota archaeon]MDE1836490.1 hypothetical protein [Euryarchaeota archaeon]MDE1880245.1 hypothetical protein [Euryarchaeota archaeon]MDE2044696.1 hypothetical protein [Thermoplasmata archaeon]